MARPLDRNVKPPQSHIINLDNDLGQDDNHTGLLTILYRHIVQPTCQLLKHARRFFSYDDSHLNKMRCDTKPSLKTSFSQSDN